MFAVRRSGSVNILNNTAIETFFALYHTLCAYYDEAPVCRTDSAMLISLREQNTLRAARMD